VSSRTESKQNDSVFEFLNSSALDRDQYSQNVTGCGPQSIKSSLEYSAWVNDLKTGKQIAQSLGLVSDSVSVGDSERSQCLDNSHKKKESRQISVISSATSRLSALDTRERDIMNRIAKFRDGIQRNEQRDKVCTFFNIQIIIITLWLLSVQ
jgi:hypothetical protein